MGLIERRDPRKVRIQRNRLHPLHEDPLYKQALYRQTLISDRGPSGVRRRNPHQSGFTGPNGLKRIDRLSGALPGMTSGSRAVPSPAAELPLHRIEAPAYLIAVVPDMPDGKLSAHDKDIISQAQQMNTAAGGLGAVCVVVFGGHREDRFGIAGVDRIVHLQGTQYNGYVPEQKVAALADLDTQFYPHYWLFPDSAGDGGDLGRRLSARLGERPATQVWQADGEHCVCRCAFQTRDIRRATPRILLLLEECSLPVNTTRHEVLPLEVSLPEYSTSIKDLGFQEVNPGEIALAEAGFIIAAGNGVSNWELFHRTAAILGATEGASRVVVDDGHMPRSRQIGATGTWVTARVYLAIGISGAIQHLQGIERCDKVIAVNTDPGCDMVKRAALSVIGDSEAIMSALIERARQYNQEEARDVA